MERFRKTSLDMLDWFLDWFMGVLGVDWWSGWEDDNEYYDPNGN